MVDSETAPLILLVEDNECNARLFREILLANRFQLSWSRDGHHCLQNASRLQPQLILMDLQLPGMDGMSVIRRLRDDPSTATIPIIALTAHAMPEHRQQFLAAGCCSYISKPISYHPFLQEIRRVLDANGSGRMPEVSYAVS